MKWYGKPKENGEVDMFIISPFMDDKEFEKRVLAILDDQGLPTKQKEETRELFLFIKRAKQLFFWLLASLGAMVFYIIHKVIDSYWS